MSLTPEQTTAQNFKNFYDRIRPLLNAQHYHVDRSGQELKTLYAGFSTDPADIDDQKYWTGIANTSLPFIKISGEFEMANNIITIPAHTKVKLDVSLSDEAATSNSLYAWYDADTNTQLNLKQLLPYATSNRPYSSSGTWIWENNTDNEKHITFKLMSFINAPKLRYRFCSMTVQEIGRIVDPVKYVSNNSDLQETPVGNIISYMGNSVPKHYLACDGTTYSIGTYPELEAFIIDEFGSINYFGGDGTSTWSVPDLRGEFLRGTGTNSHANQGNGADVGKHQDSTEFPAYYTGIGADNKYYIGYRVPNNVTSSDYNIISKADKNISKTSTSIYGNSKEDLHGTASTSNVLSTVRPTNTSVKFCIKYESTYHVIVPSHMYKVNATFDLTWNSTDQAYILNTLTYKAGDQSLIDGNVFKAPLTGWYNISLNSGQVAKTTKIMQYLHIVHNGIATIYTDGSNSDTNTGWWGLDINRTFYLEKGDTVYARVWTEGQTITLPTNMNASFCLLTANHKDNIIAGGEVYSEEEQVIGTWTNGKPLYQKTYISTANITVTSGTWSNAFTKSTAGITDAELLVKGNVIRTVNSAVRGDITFGIDGNNIQIQTSNASSYTLPSGSIFTFQYTKTIDQANTYQYKNSLLLTRPDMWEPNTEYDFGGGLYGKRLTGNLSVTTTLTAYAIDATWKNKSYTPVSSGGWISRGVMLNACNGTLVYMLYKNDSQGLCIQAKDSVQTVSYDIWVTYRKA